MSVVTETNSPRARPQVVVSDEVRVAFAPSNTYAELLAGNPQVTWLRALARPAFVVLLIGTIVPIAATGRVSLGLVASAAMSWSFVVGLQIAIGVILIASSPSRHVGMARAVDLWFAGHLPWSLWLLVSAAIARIYPRFPVEGFLLTMLLPMGWTAAIAAAFYRSVLGIPTNGARLRAALHLIAILLIVLSYVAWSAGGWFRLVG